MVTRIKERIQIAQIQKSVQKALGGKLGDNKEESKEESKEQPIREAIANLDRQLFDIDELLAYASKYSLWEQMLEIINFSQQTTSHDVVVTLWKNIIHREINTARRVKQDWGNSVRNKLKGLSGVYRSITPMFPIEDLIRTLERCNYQYTDFHEPSRTFVVSVLLDIKVSAEQLLNIYDKLLLQPEMEDVAKVYLLWSVHTITSQIYSQRFLGRRRSQLPTPRSQLEDVVNKALLELVKLPPDNSDRDSLQMEFEALKARITSHYY